MIVNMEQTVALHWDVPINLQQEKLQQCSGIANVIPCKLPMLLSCP